jgi:hypothetical protein
MRKVGIAGGITAAAAVFGLASASGASAASIPQHGLVFPTYYDCVYAGNTFAQEGGLHGFSCPQVSNGWRLDWW